jgi:hypothetical protein
MIMEIEIASAASLECLKLVAATFVTAEAQFCLKSNSSHFHYTPFKEKS